MPAMLVIPSKSVCWLIAGLVLLAGGLGLAVVAAGDTVLSQDVAIARAVQWPASEKIDRFARLMSWIGDEFPATVMLAISIAVLLSYYRRRDLALILVAAVSLRAIGPMLKFVVDSPRPSIEIVTVIVQADGLGFPSGHALGAALFYGMIAGVARQIVTNRRFASGIQVIALTMMCLIGISRVRLGVHWFSDVAGGLLFGLAVVCLFQMAIATRQHDS